MSEFSLGDHMTEQGLAVADSHGHNKEDHQRNGNVSLLLCRPSASSIASLRASICS